MAKAKSNPVLEVKVLFKGIAKIPSENIKKIDEALEAGEAAVGVQLHDIANPENYFSFDIYPDNVTGKFICKRSDNELCVDIDAIYKLELDDFTKQNLVLPAKVGVFSISDQEPNSYCFNDNEETEFTDVIIG